MALGGGVSMRCLPRCVVTLVELFVLVFWLTLFALLLISLVLCETSVELLMFVFVLLLVEFWVTSLVFWLTLFELLLLFIVDVLVLLLVELFVLLLVLLFIFELLAVTVVEF